MKAHQEQYPITTMCRVLEVSTSGYYAWLKRPQSRRAQEDEALTQQIQQIHTRSKGTYGAPRIHAALARAGTHVGRKRVARLMRAAGLQGVSRRKRYNTTQRQANARPAPDLVERNFVANGPDELWVADITYVSTWTGWLYLAVVIDAWSRKKVPFFPWLVGQWPPICAPSWYWMRWLWRSGNAVRRMSFTTPIKAASTPRWLLGSAAEKLAYVPPWVRSATVSITQCARVSLPHWSVNCWTGKSSIRRLRLARQYLPLLKDGTIFIGCTQPLAIPHPSSSKGPIPIM